MARQTTAHVLATENRFSDALRKLRGVIDELDTIGTTRDRAVAHGLAAHCLVGIGAHREAIEHAATARAFYREIGDTVGEAKAAHTAARAKTAMGDLAEVRSEFARTADIVFRAKLFEVWAIMRLDYVEAVLHDDESADVRGELESVANVSMMLDATGSTHRHQYAAEAMDYLRRVAQRDAVTRELVRHVRDFVERNAARPPVRFTPPPGTAFIM